MAARRDIVSARSDSLTPEERETAADFELLRTRCDMAQAQLGEAANVIRELRRQGAEAEAKAQVAELRAREAETARQRLQATIGDAKMAALSSAAPGDARARAMRGLLSASRMRNLRLAVRLSAAVATGARLRDALASIAAERAASSRAAVTAVAVAASDDESGKESGPLGKRCKKASSAAASSRALALRATLPPSAIADVDALLASSFEEDARAQASPGAVPVRGAAAVNLGAAWRLARRAPAGVRGALALVALAALVLALALGGVLGGARATRAAQARLPPRDARMARGLPILAAGAALRSGEYLSSCGGDDATASAGMPHADASRYLWLQPDGNVVLARGCSPREHAGAIWASNTHELVAEHAEKTGRGGAREFNRDAASAAAVPHDGAGNAVAHTTGEGGSAGAAMVLMPTGRGGLALMHAPTGKTLWKRRQFQLPSVLRPWPCPW